MSDAPPPCGGRRPVVLVHGNTEDASFWDASPTPGAVVNVRSAFLSAGWCPEQVWAISYTGSRGYFTYNDINVDEVTEFVEAVRSFTRADRVDVVSHSLGVTIVRKALKVHPSLRARVGKVVAIAGANHGTTQCRNARPVSHVCDETDPASPWLVDLNEGGETLPGVDYLTVYDGTVADHFFLGPDAHSPALAGACNLTLPGTPHYSLARGPQAAALYLTWLKTGEAPCA